MLPLLHDAIDLVRLRVRPLEAYQYPGWQPILVLALLGVAASADAPELGNNLLGRTAFLMLFTLVEMAGLVVFLRLWLRLAGVELRQSLFGLAVAASGLQLLEPLTSWLPDNLAAAAGLLLGLGSIAVLVNALPGVSGVPRLRVFAGVMLYALLAVLMLSMSLSVADGLGWITLPPDWLPAQGASSAGSASAI